MAQYPPGIRVAQAIGLTGAAYLGGNIASFSVVSVPALQTAEKAYKAPITLLVKQWRDLYDRGRAQNPPIAIAAASAFAYLAWSVHRNIAVAVLAPKHAAALYSAAAALTVGIVPWTFMAMLKTNKVLLGRAGNGTEPEWVPTEESSEEVRECLQRWRVLNGIRAALPLVGAFVGFLAF